MLQHLQTKGSGGHHFATPDGRPTICILRSWPWLNIIGVAMDDDPLFGRLFVPRGGGPLWAPDYHQALVHYEGWGNLKQDLHF